MSDEETLLEMQAVHEMKQQKKVYINNVGLLVLRSKEMNLEAIAGQKLSFLDTLCHSVQLSDKVSVEDEIAREKMFMQQAQMTAKLARSQIQDFHRPSDYFAEMVKSDEHMHRIKSKIIEQSVNIKKSQEAKKLREQKKFGKSVQTQVIQDRHKRKREDLEKIDALKKKRQQGNNNDDGFEIDLFDNEDKQNKSRSSSKAASKGKRAAKDAKFGFGGKKRNSKQNTRESLDGAPKKKFRPGKDRRHK